MRCRICRTEISKYKETRETFVRKKEEQFKEELKNSIEMSMKALGGKGKNLFLREGWKFIPQYNIGHRKVFVIERLRYVRTEGKPAHHTHRKKGEIEYRIGYFIIGKKGNRKRRWTWGQFCPLIPRKDLSKIFRAARRLRPR